MPTFGGGIEHQHKRAIAKDVGLYASVVVEQANGSWCLPVRQI